MKMLDQAVAVARQRSESWWLLSALVLDRPHAGILKQLMGAVGQVPDGLPVSESAGRLAALLSAGDAGELADRLGPEFTRLFRGLREGIDPLPPYESLYRGGALLGPATQAVIDCYAAAGFGDIVPEAGPQDHLGVELRFLSLLCHREAEALERQDESVVGELRAQQIDFLERHLLAWLPRLAEEIRRAAREPFYPDLMALSLAFARQEQEALVMPDEVASVA